MAQRKKNLPVADNRSSEERDREDKDGCSEHGQSSHGPSWGILPRGVLLLTWLREPKEASLN